MQCPACKREMTQLFLSEACDHCDFGPPRGTLHRGFIVGRPATGSESKTVEEEYVFQTRLGAESWRAAASRHGCEVHEICSLVPFHWHLSRGVLRDVVLAEHRYEIFRDHRFEPLPHRAFLAKEVE